MSCRKRTCGRGNSLAVFMAGAVPGSHRASHLLHVLQTRHDGDQFDDERHSVASAEASETVLLHRVDAQELHHALEALPLEFREVIILRELEDCSYKEIAAITGVPLGTVMSRLARARQRLQHWLVSQAEGGLS